MNKIKIIKKDDNARNMKQQSKSTFNVIHKSYTFYDTYTLKQNEVLMNRPLYLGLTILELGKRFWYETCYDKLQPYVGQAEIQLPFMDCRSFVFSIRTQNLLMT